MCCSRWQCGAAGDLICTCCLLSCAQVLDFELQKQLVPYMKEIVPLPGACSWVPLQQGQCSVLQHQIAAHMQTRLRIPPGCVDNQPKCLHICVEWIWLA